MCLFRFEKSAGRPPYDCQWWKPSILSTFFHCAVGNNVEIMFVQRCRLTQGRQTDALFDFLSSRKVGDQSPYFIFSDAPCCKVSRWVQTFKHVSQSLCVCDFFSHSLKIINFFPLKTWIFAFMKFCWLTRKWMRVRFEMKWWERSRWTWNEAMQSLRLKRHTISTSVRTRCTVDLASSESVR